MLRNERYRGVYVHGTTRKKHVGDKRVKVANEHGTIRGTLPQIVSDDLWFTVQEHIADRTCETEHTGAPRPDR